MSPALSQKRTKTSGILAFFSATASNQAPDPGSDAQRPPYPPSSHSCCYGPQSCPRTPLHSAQLCWISFPEVQVSPCRPPHHRRPRTPGRTLKRAHHATDGVRRPRTSRCACPAECGSGSQRSQPAGPHPLHARDSGSVTHSAPQWRGKVATQRPDRRGFESLCCRSQAEWFGGRFLNFSPPHYPRL